MGTGLDSGGDPCLWVDAGHPVRGGGATPTSLLTGVHHLGGTCAWEVLVVNPTPATGRVRRARVAAAGAVAGLLLLTGCGAGQVASTTSQVAAVNGGQGRSSQVEVRDVVMAYPPTDNATWPAGSDVPLSLTVVNSADSDDDLVRVSTPAASSVEVTGTTRIPTRSAVVALEGGQGSPQGADPNAAGTAPGTALFAGTLQVTLQGLTRPVTSGLTVPVTFTFSQAGDITVPVPIAAAEYERSQGTHDGLTSAPAS